MRKNIYRILILLSLLVCIMFSSVSVYASEGAVNIRPRNTNIKYSTISLSLSDGTANCSASVTGYTTNTNRVSIDLYLQKYSNGSWSNISSWSDSANSYTLSVYHTKRIAAGRYRLKASYHAQSENIIKYSAEKVY